VLGKRKLYRASHGQNKTEIQFINPKAKDDVLITINSYHGKRHDSARPWGLLSLLIVTIVTESTRPNMQLQRGRSARLCFHLFYLVSIWHLLGNVALKETICLIHWKGAF
jgi:hypothetical protein